MVMKRIFWSPAGEAVSSERERGGGNKAGQGQTRSMHGVPGASLSGETTVKGVTGTLPGEGPSCCRCPGGPRRKTPTVGGAFPGRLPRCSWRQVHTRLERVDIS